MPFKSEKQRRFLWAEHPDIARRWADEYPLNGKKLPMYAKDTAENNDEQTAKNKADVVKAAKDVLKRIKMPADTKPTYAGQTDISSEQASTSILDENTPKVEETPELNKCGMIPGTGNAQKWENEKARAEGRPAQRISAVPGVKRQIVPNIYNPLPMAMSAQSGNSAPKPAAAQSATPANDAANKLMKNTIGNFGPIAANGNLNGNAAFGVKNSPNSSKTSNYHTNEKSARISAPMCPCGCGEKSYNCTCPKWCVCRNPGMPCAPKKRKAKAKLDAQEKSSAEGRIIGHGDGYDPAWEHEPHIGNWQQQNKTYQNFNRAAATVSPLLMSSLGRQFGSGVGSALGLAANLGHASFGKSLREQQNLLKQGPTYTSSPYSRGGGPIGRPVLSPLLPSIYGNNNGGITKQNSAIKYAAPPNLEVVPPAERMIDELLRINKTHRNINTAVSAVSPMLLNSLGKRLGFGVGPALSLGANLGHAGVAHGLNTQQKMLQNFQGRSYITKQNSAIKYARYGARGLIKGISENAETEGELDPTAAALVGLLGAGGIYGTLYAGKKILSPVARRMSVSTLAPEDVGQFSLPVVGGNDYSFAERYRRPNILGSLFADSDANAVSNALMHMAKKVPGSAARLERHSEQPSLEPRDLDFVGQYLVNKYPHRYRNTQVKSALDVTRGGIGSRALASTLGHLGSFPVMTILEPRSHVNPTQWTGERGIFDRKVRSDDARAQKHVQLAEDMARANPKELENTRVYLGGPNLFREYGQLFTNPRTSLLGKTHGALSMPIQTLLANIGRGSAYNPYTDSVYLMGDSPAVLSHEIGHALDFNSGGAVPEYEPGKSKIKTWLQRQSKGLKRDAYTIGRALPFYGNIHALHQEERANTLSRQNLERAYAKDSDKLNDILDKRQRILPAGMGSYVGNAAAGLAGPFGQFLQTPFSIGGAIGGKIYGMQQAARRNKKYVPDNKSDSRSEEEDKPKDEVPDTIKIPERKEKTKDKDKEELKKAAKQLGLWDAAPVKTSAYKGISEFSGMPGPDQISHAVSQLGMLKALVRPDDSVLKQRGITRSGFQSGLRDIYNHSRNKDRFELSELAPQPNTHAALGGLGGLGAAGLLGYAGVRDPAILAGTAAIPAVAAYFRARNKRHNLLNTAKLVKDYGLLRPKLLRQAYPLLAADE